MNKVKINYQLSKSYVLISFAQMLMNDHRCHKESNKAHRSLCRRVSWSFYLLCPICL